MQKEKGQEILDLLEQMQKETTEFRNEFNAEISEVRENNKKINELLVSINERLETK